MSRRPILRLAVAAFVAASAAVLAAASGSGCSRAEDKWREGLQQRVAALRYFPLPAKTITSGPAGVFLNTMVPKILLESRPTGATVVMNDRAVGTTPCELPTTDLTVERGREEGAACALSFAVGGATRAVTRYRLRFEAADFGTSLEPTDLPELLRGRDHFLYVMLEGEPKAR